MLHSTSSSACLSWYTHNKTQQERLIAILDDLGFIADQCVNVIRCYVPVSQAQFVTDSLPRSLQPAEVEIPPTIK